MIAALQSLHVSVTASLHRHEGPRCVETARLLDDGSRLSFPGESSRWQFDLTAGPEIGGAGQIDLRASVVAGPARQASVGIDFDFGVWSPDVYVLVPGAIYAGNRFPAITDAYPPLPPLRGASDPDQRPRITQVPRLSAEPGPSVFSIPSSDPAIPAIGFWFPASKRGLWLLTADRNDQGLFGYALEENAERSSATLRISSPCVRPHAYEMCNDKGPSPDQARDFAEGETVGISVRVHVFECPEVQDLYDQLIALRNAVVPNPRRRCAVPLSAVWGIQEDKFNRENWVEEGGFYAVGVEPMRSASIHQHWQAGWVGGMISTHALYLRGDATSRTRALRNFDFLCSQGQGASGFFYGTIHRGRVIGDHFRDENAPWHLLRKSADVLYYSLATLEAVKARGESARIRPEWWEALQRCADAFVRLWDANGQFGQFVDHDTGELLVSGSASAGIAPAGLVLAARAFPERGADYMRVACQAAAYYDRHYIRKGLTNGGPGEIAQGADSESAAGLLESFVTLAEATGDARWLDAARRCAAQAASWVFSYDPAFPPESTFGKMDMLAGGTVLANVQNKHSAPGMCTHSGLSLFRLFRLTGAPFYLDLLRDIARALPQYMSREDRPIEWKIPYNTPTDPATRHLHPGWMCERVNVTQWGPTEPAGEVFYYSCWSEFALALTCAELPGVYAQPDTGRIWCIDGVEARWVDDSRKALELANPTAFPATVRILVEPSAEARRTKLGSDFAAHLPTVEVDAGASAVFSL